MEVIKVGHHRLFTLLGNRIAPPGCEASNTEVLAHLCDLCKEENPTLLAVQRPKGHLRPVRKLLMGHWYSTKLHYIVDDA